MTFAVRSLGLDLPAVSGSFSRRLHDAGVPVTAERAAWFAGALSAVEPVSRRRLYWTARAVFVTEPGQARAFDAVFSSVFGSRPSGAETPEPSPDEHDSQPASAPAEEPRRGVEGGADEPAPSATSHVRGARPGEVTHDVPVPVLASDEEVLRTKHFDALDAAELAGLYRLMTRIRVATPERRTRRSERDRHGERIDLRRTLRGSLRTAGDPIRLARRRRRTIRRRIVLLCDISGSMEPYARAYLQFLTCAAGA
jgi:uncharacterized protein with von Willebrand factor type A (vWA) domain